ncbi:hypothetical protein GBA63_06165 [Rubrobacter tropicus]|uniref:N-acetyltransferase domain-containing protein n=1 Tax=Rubrobacter tropicus TaxID=2653851 RepID=A0A6G8Q756_9ACTN|nr:hypothetical protein [Rubrobacter tropicus]QIN82282.1 hypothetical protein GBA63_06165 [Rubrobacter tropicus]
MDEKKRWTNEAVLRESGRWVHVPAGCALVEDAERLMVHPPEFRGTSRVWRSWPARHAAEDLILKTVQEVCASGGERLVWHTGDAVSPPFMDGLLSRHGFEKTEDLEVLAFELGDGPRPMLPRLDVPAEIRATPARNGAELEEAHAIASRVFPNSPPLSEPEVRAYLRGIERVTRQPDAGGGACEFRFLALLRDPAREEEAIATAGAQVVGETVRLWGAGTLAEYRRRGAYGALVVERCRLAHALGATLALTKANEATSAPLLRNAGFRTIASERRHALQTSHQAPIPQPPAQ